MVGEKTTTSHGDDDVFTLNQEPAYLSLDGIDMQS